MNVVKRAEGRIRLWFEKSRFFFMLWIPYIPANLYLVLSMSTRMKGPCFHRGHCVREANSIDTGGRQARAGLPAGDGSKRTVQH